MSDTVIVGASSPHGLPSRQVACAICSATVHISPDSWLLLDGGASVMCIACGTMASLLADEVHGVRKGQPIPLPDAFEIQRESRARAIRAVVAAQWAVACAMFAAGGITPVTMADIKDMEGGRSALGDGEDYDDWSTCIHDVAALPTPVQIVDGDA